MRCSCWTWPWCLGGGGYQAGAGPLAAEGSVQLGISVGEDRKLVVLDGRAPHLLEALNDLLRPPLANLELGVHWTSLQVHFGASSDWHSDQVVGRLATTVLADFTGGELFRSRCWMLPRFLIHSRATGSVPGIQGIDFGLPPPSSGQYG